MRYYNIFIKKVEIKKIDYDKYWRGFEVIGIFIYYRWNYILL